MFKIVYKLFKNNNHEIGIRLRKFTFAFSSPVKECEY